MTHLSLSEVVSLWWAWSHRNGPAKVWPDGGATCPLCDDPVDAMSLTACLLVEMAVREVWTADGAKTVLALADWVQSQPNMDYRGFKHGPHRWSPGNAQVVYRSFLHVVGEALKASPIMRVAD